MRTITLLIALALLSVAAVPTDKAKQHPHSRPHARRARQILYRARSIDARQTEYIGLDQLTNKVYSLEAAR